MKSQTSHRHYLHITVWSVLWKCNATARAAFQKELLPRFQFRLVRRAINTLEDLLFLPGNEVGTETDTLFERLAIFVFTFLDHLSNTLM